MRELPLRSLIPRLAWIATVAACALDSWRTARELLCCGSSPSTAAHVATAGRYGAVVLGAGALMLLLRLLGRRRGFGLMTLAAGLVVLTGFMSYLDALGTAFGVAVG